MTARDGATARAVLDFADSTGRGAGADDGDALAGEVDVVVPAGGVDRLALEALDARHVRQRRLDQPAAAADEHVRGQAPAAGLQPPSSASSSQRPATRSVPVCTCGRTPSSSVTRSM
jgi:hypothetical protein